MFDIICTILENGNLKVSIEDGFLNDPENIEDLNYIMSERSDFDILVDACEHYWVNGSFHPFDASEANPYVGLTDAICIAECINTNDNGESTIEGDFWYYPDSAIHNIFEKIIEDGFVIFVKGN